MGAGYHGGFGSTKAGANNPAPGAVNIVNPVRNDMFGIYAQKAKELEGYTDVIIHGNPETDKVSIMHNNKWVDLDQRRLAKYLKKSKGYKAGAIRLLSCSAGSKEFAQNLANKMGVSVLAATDTVWAHPNGKITVGPSSYINSGSWVEFQPRKRGKK